jgi:hypothetical protein
MSISVPCPVCGSYDGHEPDCEVVAIEELQRKNTHIDCPQCNGLVGINDSDYYECRGCHRQFSSSLLVDGALEPKELVLVDLRKDRSFPVLALEAKGAGKFPVDQAIEKLQKRIREKSRATL